MPKQKELGRALVAVCKAAEYLDEVDFDPEDQDILERNIMQIAQILNDNLTKENKKRFKAWLIKKEKEAIKDMTPCGYGIGYGYKGLMPDGSWQLFATEEEYNEALEES